MLHAVILALHLSALSQLESGDDDFAVGLRGEISRYQIRPEIWQEKAAGLNPRDPETSKKITIQIWQARVDQFEKTRQRDPSFEEMYLLWNCPAHIDEPHKGEWEKAVRFKNLCLRKP